MMPAPRRNGGTSMIDRETMMGIVATEAVEQIAQPPKPTAAQRLETALTAWRKAEIAHSVAILRGYHPDTIAMRDRTMEEALGKVRALVDSEPWADLAAGL